MSAVDNVLATPAALPASPRLLRDLAQLVSGGLSGSADTPIYGASDIRDAAAGDIVFAESRTFLEAALHGSASAVVTHPDVVSPEWRDLKPLILVANPRIAFVQILEVFATPWQLPVGTHPTAFLAPSAQIGEGVCIGPHVSIESDVILGDRVVIMAGSRVGTGCRIEEDTILYPNVVLYPRVKVGKRCLLHAGCVLGADGFGYEQVNRRLQKVAHIGTVELGDEVEVGANTCIDRAKTGTTVIGSGTKLDNLVHIAHNVRIGQSSLIIAQVGVAGSVTIGNGVILAGQAGVADHLEIADGAQVGAQGGVIGNVGRGEKVSGYPARPHARKMREYAAIAALPEYIKRIRILENRLAELEARLPNRDTDRFSTGASKEENT